MAFNTGGAVGGAASGAQMGSMIMPGWGTAIGAVAGGLMGGLGGGDGPDMGGLLEQVQKQAGAQMGSNYSLLSPYASQGGLGMGWLAGALGQGGLSAADQARLADLQSREGKLRRLTDRNVPLKNVDVQRRYNAARGQLQELATLQNMQSAGSGDFQSQLMNSPLFAAMQNVSQTPAMRALAARGLSPTDGMNSEMLGRLSSQNMLGTFGQLSGIAQNMATQGQNAANSLGQLNSNLAGQSIGATASLGNTGMQLQQQAQTRDLNMGLQGLQSMSSYMDPSNQLSRKISRGLLDTPLNDIFSGLGLNFGGQGTGPAYGGQ